MIRVSARIQYVPTDTRRRYDTNCAVGVQQRYVFSIRTRSDQPLTKRWVAICAALSQDGTLHLPDPPPPHSHP
jgi:hypothetical protein